MYFEQVMRGSDLTNFINTVLSYNRIAKEDSGNQWTLGKPDNVSPEYLWEFCKIDGL